MLYCLLPEVQKEALRTMPNLEDIGVAMRPRALSGRIRIQERTTGQADSSNGDSGDARL
jgi:hypothetical protein